jgi:F0F1-type ATP synthase membrane subunit b/b'
MKRLFPFLVALVLLAGLPLAAAESEPEHGNMAIWEWLNFALLAGGLGYVVVKNAGPYFAQRSVAIRKGIIEADEARAEAEAKSAEVDRRLAKLKSEIEALRQAALQEAEAEAERARHEAAAELAKIQAQLAAELAAASKAARLELRRFSAAKALELAELKIAARMSPVTQDRLVSTFVRHLADPSVRLHSN